MGKKVDVIYPVGTGSTWDNNELKYSLRSLEKHGKDVRNVYIIGEKPEFISDEVTFIPFKDEHSYAVINVNEKILHVLNNWEVTDDFVYMNDDFFLLKDVNLGQYPYYYKRNLKPEEEKSRYGKSLVFTYYYLIFQQKKYKNFELHLPIVFNRDKYMAMEKEWDVCRKMPLGLQLRSIYCNMLEIEGVKTRDSKIRTFDSVEEVSKTIEFRDCFSIADSSIECGMDHILNELFPDKSKYEI